MRQLHELTGEITAWVWWMYYPGNRGSYSRYGQRNVQLNLLHLREVVRRPPRRALGDRMRAYTSVWGSSFVTSRSRDPRSPLCGRIGVGNVTPGVMTAGMSDLPDAGTTWRAREYCPNCLAIANRRQLNPSTLDRVSINDPWYRMPSHDRITMLDPISGR